MMRKWINLIEQQLEEIAHDPKHPMDDELSQKHLINNYQNMQSELKEVGKIGNLSILSSEWPLMSNAHMFLTYQNQPVGELYLTNRRSSDIFRIISVYIMPEHRGGTGMALYSFLLDHGLILRSDKEHTDHSKALWAKLARDGQNVVHHWSKDAEDRYHKGEEVTDTEPYYDGSRSFFTVKRKDLDLEY